MTDSLHGKRKLADSFIPCDTGKKWLSTETTDSRVGSVNGHFIIFRFWYSRSTAILYIYLGKKVLDHLELGQIF